MTQKIVKETETLKVKKPGKPVWPYKRRRWLFPIFTTFVDTIAKIMYKQREIKGGYIIAIEEDVETAKQLWKVYEKNIIYRVSATAMVIYELIPEEPHESLTHAEIAEATGMSTETVRRHCKELTKEGLINFRKRQGGRGAWEYWRSKPSYVDSIIIEKNDHKNTRKKNKNSKSKNNLKTARFCGQTNNGFKEEELWKD